MSTAERNPALALDEQDTQFEPLEPHALEVATTTPTHLTASADVVGKTQALQRLTDTVALMNAARPLIARATLAQDWVIQKGGEGKPPTLYLQSTGIERLAPIAGLDFGIPDFEETAKPNGGTLVICRGDASCRLFNIRLRGVEGTRSSDDVFFTGKQFYGDKPNPSYVSPDQVDIGEVRKAAYANWRTRAASMLLGLRNMRVEDLKSLGFDISKLVEVEYGGKSGTAAGGDGTSGRSKDAISEAKEKRLWAIAGARAKSLGVGDDGKEEIIKAALAKFGFKTTQEIHWKQYDALVAWVEACDPGDIK